jgi:GNAT superfamily N-acetyltransferase
MGGAAVADAIIDVVGMDELPLVVELYNQIFRPHRQEDSFKRRYLGRYNVLQLVARVNDRPVGFFLGFELKPDVFFSWFYGVLPDFRRTGIGSQLLEASQSWAAQHGYESMRLECHNQHRPVLHLAIHLGYDIIGIRWDADRGDNLVLFEKSLAT